MIILTSFLSIGFVSTSIILCWLSDKYSETLEDLEKYKRQNKFLQNQIEEIGEYKNVLQSHKKGTKRNPKAY